MQKQDNHSANKTDLYCIPRLDELHSRPAQGYNQKVEQTQWVYVANKQLTEHLLLMRILATKKEEDVITQIDRMTFQKFSHKWSSNAIFSEPPIIASKNHIHEMLGGRKFSYFLINLICSSRLLRQGPKSEFINTNISAMYVIQFEESILSIFLVLFICQIHPNSHYILFTHL